MIKNDGNELDGFDVYNEKFDAALQAHPFYQDLIQEAAKSVDKIELFLKDKLNKEDLDEFGELLVTFKLSAIMIGVIQTQVGMRIGKDDEAKM